jgi:hypothetical protein
MVKHGNKTFAVLALLALPSSCFAGEGTTAADYLNIDPSARSTAMGSAYAAAGDDAFSFFHNPAGLSLVNRTEIALSHVAWVESMHSEYGAVAVPLKNGFVAAAGGSYFSSGELDAVDSDGDTLGSYEYYGVSGGAALARRSGDLAFGLTAKTVREAMAGFSSSALAVDAGALYFAGPVTLALALQNYGGSVKLGSVAFDLPENFVAGAAWRYSPELLLSTEYDKPAASGSSAREYAGAEYKLTGDNFMSGTFLRGGWNFNRDTGTGSGITFGVGVIVGERYTLDYAMAPMGDFGTTQRMSLKIALGSNAERSVSSSAASDTTSGTNTSPVLSSPENPVPEKKNKDSVEAAEADYRAGKISIQELQKRLRELGFE